MSHKKKSAHSATDSRNSRSSGNYIDKSDKNLSDKSGNTSYSDKSDCDSQNYSD
ncbi:MAG: hypothetical protein NC340_06185 [Ruminococcus flavefaciens]|nr:hypothetical protein [Ruminococcus flavefaciens]MCM1230428.1 hypothetical protein [Ruminococcus flavefaciens]